ncbi:MAG: restriction endonuclease [Bifidobacterium crudilactis]|jgi:adenylate kinase family enzyme|nr:restriction endonuclease [Bifidobacterium crudilactis]
MSNVGVRADSLDSEEFERFAVDLSKILFNNQQVHGFPEGKDQGIDGLDDSTNPTLVIQAKRWSPYKTNAKKQVVEEIQKIQQTAIDFSWTNDFHYVFVTSVGLTPQVQHDLRCEFPQLFPSDKYLIDKARINELSSAACCENVFRKYKLIGGNLSTILTEHRFRILSEDFPTFNPHYYVETEFLQKAHELIMNRHILLVHGNPGVGKTSLCKMLGNLFANSFSLDSDKKTKVIWRSLDEAQDVIKEYSESFKADDRILFIVFDDFLGSNSLETDTSELQKLDRLLDRLRYTANLYIVLNSRTQILKSARQQFNNLDAKLSGDLRDSIAVLDMLEYNDLDRAKILRSNLEQVYSRRSDIDKERFQSNYEQLRQPIKKSFSFSRTIEKQYYEIIEHKNFNPRLIEYISNHFADDPDVLGFIQHTLNNPEYIYNPIFERLSSNEQWLLFNLFAFTGRETEEAKLAQSTKNYSSSEFDPYLAIEKLNQSWFGFKKLGVGEREVGFANPGIVDFLDRKNKSIRFLDEIREKSQFLDQIRNTTSMVEFYSTIWERWDAFQDSMKFQGERIVTLIKFQDDTEICIDLLADALNTYDGIWNLDYSNGWRIIFSALSDRSDDLLHQFFGIILQPDIQEDCFTRIFNPELLDINEFDSLIEIVEPMIMEFCKFDISAGAFGDLRSENPGYELVSAIYEAKRDLIQQQLDSPEDYSDSIQEQISDGLRDDEIEDSVFADTLSSECGNLLELYEPLDNFDITEISDLISKIRDSMENQFDEEERDSGSSFSSGPTNRYEIDRVLDCPLN